MIFLGDEEQVLLYSMEKVDYSYVLIPCNLLKYTVFNQDNFKTEVLTRASA